MAIIQAIILGIVEGLTEFLPISSTGHLIVSQRVIGYKDTAELFTVVVQMGAILAVIWYYRHDLLSKTRGLLNNDRSAVLFWRNWVVATIPAGLLGAGLEQTLGNIAKPAVVAGSLIAGGIVILLIERYHRAPPSAQQPNLSGISLGQSMKIGLFQTLALIPGVSRSGATIMGSLTVGVDRVTATAFSFYLSIPILVLASGFKLATHSAEIANVSGGGVAIAAGVVSAFITGLVAVKWLLKYVATHDFRPFAYYRMVVGACIIVLIATGTL